MKQLLQAYLKIGCDDGDTNCYDLLIIKIKDDKVIVRAKQTEYSADRPGESYRGYESVVISTIDESNKFTKAEKYENC